MKEKIILLLAKCWESVQIYWDYIVERVTGMNATEIYWTSIVIAMFFLYLIYRVFNFMVAMFVMFAMIFAYAIYHSPMYEILLKAVK